MYYLPKIFKRLRFTSIKHCSFQKQVKIFGGSQLLNVEVGRYSYIGYNATIINASIGSFCSIAGDCIIGGGEHPSAFVSTSPVFYKGSNALKRNFSNKEFNPYKRTVIGNDVWIANGVKIKSGISVSDGAVIGMGAVVTKNIGPYEIWGGNPARLIRKRFSDEMIEELMRIVWWNWDEKELLKYGNDFFDPEVLINHYKLSGGS